MGANRCGYIKFGGRWYQSTEQFEQCMINFEYLCQQQRKAKRIMDSPYTSKEERERVKKIYDDLQQRIDLTYMEEPEFLPLTDAIKEL